ALLYTEKFNLPVLFRVGLSWPVKFGENHQVLFAVDAFHPNDNTESVSFGVEWKFFDLLALRGGYQNFVPEGNDQFPYVFNKRRDSEAGLTLGAGLQYDLGATTLRFDYGWADFNRLENTQRFSLGFSF
ncbi:MAG: hypothetical protein ONA90_05145, partial [candidate division KSB1 bacterium]|nr:hypothetical protein [candidate division KSB1 bacterium]